MSDHRYIIFRLENQTAQHDAPKPTSHRGWTITHIDPDLIMAELLLTEWTRKCNPTSQGPEEITMELERGMTLTYDFALKPKKAPPTGRKPVP